MSSTHEQPTDGNVLNVPDVQELLRNPEKAYSTMIDALDIVGFAVDEALRGVPPEEQPARLTALINTGELPPIIQIEADARSSDRRVAILGSRVDASTLLSGEMGGPYLTPPQLEHDYVAAAGGFVLPGAPDGSGSFRSFNLPFCERVELLDASNGLGFSPTPEAMVRFSASWGLGDNDKNAHTAFYIGKAVQDWQQAQELKALPVMGAPPPEGF